MPASPPATHVPAIVSPTVGPPAEERAVARPVLVTHGLPPSLGPRQPVARGYSVRDAGDDPWLVRRRRKGPRTGGDAGRRERRVPPYHRPPAASTRSACERTRVPSARARIVAIVGVSPVQNAPGPAAVSAGRKEATTPSRGR